MDPKLEAAHRKLAARVMGQPGVSGTAIGLSAGRHCLMVYLSDERASKKLPRTVDGFRVVVEVTGVFRRL